MHVDEAREGDEVMVDIHARLSARAPEGDSASICGAVEAHLLSTYAHLDTSRTTSLALSDDLPPALESLVVCGARALRS